MARIIKNNLGKFLVICFVFSIVTGWIFSGWPQIWQNPSIPPEVQEAKASEATKTFVFETTAESWVANDGIKSTLSYDAGTGNPAGALKVQTTIKNAGSTGYWEWVGTWEDLGIPIGATVTQIRVNAGYTRCTAYTLGDPSTVGPYEIWDNEAVPAIMATLWSGRAITATDADWVAITQQADQAVSASYQASGSTIRLRLNNFLDAQNSKNPIDVTIYDDQVSFVATYSVAATVSCTTEPASTGFGTLTIGSVHTATSTATTTMSCTYGSGCTLYVKDAGDTSNPGLYNATATDVVDSATETLIAGTEGYGIQAATTSAGTGTELELAAVYFKTGNDVGALALTNQELASSTTTFDSREIVITHKATISGLNKPGNYTDTITYECVGN